MIDPSAFRAAKAPDVDTTWVKPVLVGAPVPPAVLLPQAKIEPSFFSAANAARLALNLVKVVKAGEGAPMPPPSLAPQAIMDPLVLDPWIFSAAKARDVANTWV